MTTTRDRFGFRPRRSVLNMGLWANASEIRRGRHMPALEPYVVRRLMGPGLLRSKTSGSESWAPVSGRKRRSRMSARSALRLQQEAAATERYLKLLEVIRRA